MADPASLAERARELAGDAGTLAHNLDALARQIGGAADGGGDGRRRPSSSS